MSLKLVEVLDYATSYDYCPPRKDAVINTEEIVSAVPCESRASTPTMYVRFKNGSHMTVLGVPTDLLPTGKERP